MRSRDQVDSTFASVVAPDAKAPRRGKTRRALPAPDCSPPAGEPGAVLVCSDHDAELQQILDVVRECGATPHTACDALHLAGPGRSAHYLCAVVGAAAQSSDDPLNLRTIGRFAELGLDVLACAPHACAWPLAMRCRVLLAGARIVLDSAQRDFGSELKSALLVQLQASLRRRQESERLKHRFAALGIIGESEPMAAIFRWVIKVAHLSDLPVLITGETGTGKEWLARALHRLDAKRCGRPFVVVNCAAISPGLAESEFFGHRRGAFTGADRDRPGLFRSAQGGVLFLDEIGELGLDLQAKLLRALQERAVLGVGDDRETPVDLRIVAATNRDLRQMVRNQRFRDDLYHRLGMLPIEIPPLRLRPADIAPLVAHFVAKHGALLPERRFVPGRDFVEAIGCLALPGNIRELENLVSRALVEKTSDSPLGLCDLPPEIWRELSSAGATPADTPAPAGGEQFVNLVAARGLKLDESLAYCEKLLLQATLQMTHNNQSQAAKLLGITPRSVYNKLRRYRLPAVRAGSAHFAEPDVAPADATILPALS